MRDQVIQKIEEEKIIAIVRGVGPEQCMKVADALYAGGIRLMEITYNQKDPASFQATADAISAITNAYEGRMFVGAGTVTTSELVELTAKASGKFIISPDTNADVIRRTRELDMVSMPGALTPTEIMTAHRAGADYVKLFPAGDLGPNYVKAVRAPISHVKMTAVGGINEKNMLDYLAYDKILCCGGSWMVPADAVAAKDWARITELTRSAVNTMLGFELRHVGVNCENEDESMAVCRKLSALLNWPIKEGNSSNFVGTGFEMMKKMGRGRNGHIAIGTNSVKRAKWHLEQRGFKFIEDSAVVKNGKLIAIYLEDEIGGFAFHLVQK